MGAFVLENATNVDRLPLRRPGISIRQIKPSLQDICKSESNIDASPRLSLSLDTLLILMISMTTVHGSLHPLTHKLIRSLASSHVDSPIRTIVIVRIPSESIRNRARRTIDARIILSITRIPVSCRGSGYDNVFFVGWVDEA